MRRDLLIQRLNDLETADLKSLLVGGLRVPERRIKGLEHDRLVERCSAELRRAAGSTARRVANRRGPHAFPYKQILIDVADKLTPGYTPLSWTPYKLQDDHAEEEIEAFILELFEERVRRWWAKLPKKRKAEFTDGINSVLQGSEDSRHTLKPGMAPLLGQQALEQVIQGGVVTGLSKVSASGLLGVAGISLVGQLGWVILVQTVGWMTGLKIALFGVGGYGAMGGAVTAVGASAVGFAVAVPGTLLFLDGPAYRKTIPTVVMLLAKTRLDDDAESADAAGQADDEVEKE